MLVLLTQSQRSRRHWTRAVSGYSRHLGSKNSAGWAHHLLGLTLLPPHAGFSTPARHRRASLQRLCVLFGF